MAQQQLWFFVREDMNAMQFSQAWRSLEEIRKMDLSLELCLRMTKTAGDIVKFAFYIHSQSMAAVVQLLSDESIITTYNLYCQSDPAVTITVRKAIDPSPNSSRAASHEGSLAERRKVSAKRGLLYPELFIQPRVRHVSGSSDVFTLEPIEDEDQMVSIHHGENFATFTKDYLVGWIEARQADLKDITEVWVQYCDENNITHDIQLTADVWQQSLIRGPWKSTFAPIWEEHILQQYERNFMLGEILASAPDFRQSCQNFVHDLRTFGSNKGSQARLESSGHEFYIGQPYFSDGTRDAILKLPASGKRTLHDVLRTLAVKRANSTIWASDDLAPIFEAILCVS